MPGLLFTQPTPAEFASNSRRPASFGPAQFRPRADYPGVWNRRWRDNTSTLGTPHRLVNMTGLSACFTNLRRRTPRTRHTYSRPTQVGKNDRPVGVYYQPAGGTCGR